MIRVKLYVFNPSMERKLKERRPLVKQQMNIKLGTTEEKGTKLIQKKDFR